eukprot:8002951-Pyramimonas_sp.AAC.1
MFRDPAWAWVQRKIVSRRIQSIHAQGRIRLETRRIAIKPTPHALAPEQRRLNGVAQQKVGEGFVSEDALNGTLKNAKKCTSLSVISCFALVQPRIGLISFDLLQKY